MKLTFTKTTGLRTCEAGSCHWILSQSARCFGGQKNTRIVSWVSCFFVRLSKGFFPMFVRLFKCLNAKQLVLLSVRLPRHLIKMPVACKKSKSSMTVRHKLESVLTFTADFKLTGERKLFVWVKLSFTQAVDEGFSGCLGGPD